MSLDFPIVTISGDEYQFFEGNVPEGISAQAVLAFVYFNGQLLISKVENRGWCVPSGRIESGESALAAVHREAMEEAGVELIDPTPIGYFRIRTQSSSECFAIAYACQSSSEEQAPLQFEATETKWIPLDKLPAIYYQWNELFESVIQFAYKKVREFQSNSREA
ncbi:NUDIX domain-containing protein [Kamptonema cortianum]|nr:NUDIX domain-containing protein [Geitlerinema splendidum]MDK3155945.1 NUDIX domain-containing protein [Kamptonema cortianum]